MANKIQVCLYFSLIDEHVLYFFHLEFLHMEKFIPNRAQPFLRNKYTVYTMNGIVALLSVQKKNFRRATVLQLPARSDARFPAYRVYYLLTMHQPQQMTTTTSSETENKAILMIALS